MGELLGLSYSQYYSLNTSHGTDGGEIILQSKSFSVGHYPLHSREINLWKTVIIYCLQGGVGWGGVGWGIGGSWLCHNKNPADLPVRLCNILIIPLHYKLIGSHFSAVPPCKLLCAP